MTEAEFIALVERIGLSPVPERFRAMMDNVAIVVEDAPPGDLLRSMGIPEGDTLLGLYQGVPHTERGDEYGMTIALPDKITIYRVPTLEAAQEDGLPVEEVVAETIWHEVGHHFGLSEEDIESRTFRGWTPPR